jgi:flavodoxin
MVLAKVFVIYDSKFGNTRRQPRKSSEIKAVEEIKTAIVYVKEVNPAELADYDLIVLGPHNHMDNPSRAMKKFVESLSEIGLKAKYVAVFDTHSGREDLLIER